jgi:hypothetical protein
MSAFLGPIHFWLYNKIQIQQGIVEEILKVSEDIAPGLRDELDTRYEVSITSPLEEVIDETNIHGWLQQQVEQSEYKLAYCVTSLIEKDPTILEKMETIFRQNGKNKSTLTNTSSPAEAYKAITDSLLDGMPCDHANTVIEDNENQIMWKRNTCVHKTYWDEVGGDITNYYDLRGAFIRGFLIGTSLVYEKIDEVNNRIRRSEANE